MKTKRTLRCLLSILLLVGMLSALLTGCSEANHDNDVKAPKKKSELVGRNYEEVVKLFVDAGFTNVKTESIDDLILGWFTQDGEVESVTINGETSFSTAKWYPKDVEVIISYHTFPEDTGTDPEPSNNPSTPVEPEPDPSVEYTSVTVAQMLEDLESNALKAQETYKNQYLEITGKLGNIDASGKYISLEPVNSSFTLINVQCYVKGDYQKAQVTEMKKGDIVTLRGKCTSVGEVLGYSLNIDSIDGYEPSSNDGGSADETIVVTAAQLVDDLSDNALKAKNTYEGRALKVTGEIDSIDSDGKYISIIPVGDSWCFTSITCYIKTEEVKKAIMELKTGSKVTITGKCTSVGEILGYSINIESIE